MIFCAFGRVFGNLLGNLPQNIYAITGTNGKLQAPNYIKQIFKFLEKKSTGWYAWCGLRHHILVARFLFNNARI